MQCRSTKCYAHKEHDALIVERHVYCVVVIIEEIRFSDYYVVFMLVQVKRVRNLHIFEIYEKIHVSIKCLLSIVSVYAS